MNTFRRGPFVFAILFTLFILIGTVSANQKESTKEMIERVMMMKVSSLKAKASPNGELPKISVKAEKINDPLDSPFDVYRVEYENDGKPMGAMTVSVIEKNGERFLFTGGMVWDLEQDRDMQYLWTKLTEKNDIQYSSDHLIAGKAEGCKIPVAVFSDYLCYYCKRFMPEVKNIVEKSDDMCLYLYDMPLTKIHKMAKYIAQMALAYQSISGEIIPESVYESTFKDEDSITEYFEDLIAQKKIPQKDFYKMVSSPEILARIEGDMELASGLNLNGTPSVFIDGHKVEPRPDEVNMIISYVRKMQNDPKSYASK